MKEIYSRQYYQRFCKGCNKQFTALRRDQGVCSRQCMNKKWNNKAKRLSLKLSDEQREVILALQDYFLSNGKG